MSPRGAPIKADKQSPVKDKKPGLLDAVIQPIKANALLGSTVNRLLKVQETEKEKAMEEY